jgi:hypothetical protein
MKQLHYVAAALMLFGAQAALAQAPSGTTTPPAAPHGGAAGAANRATATHTPACQSVIGECKTLGFIVGQASKDNGLWKDCFDPVVKGGTPTRDGKPLNVPVNSSDVQACRAAVFGSAQPAAAPAPH